MYANTDNPQTKEVKIPDSRLNEQLHIIKAVNLVGILKLIAQANGRKKYSMRQYDTYTFLSFPFVSRERWASDIRKWSYITYRLERYYLKKVCDLNSIAFKSISREGDYSHLDTKAF